MKMTYFREVFSLVPCATHSLLASTGRMLLLSSSVVLLVAACGGKTDDKSGVTSGDGDVTTRGSGDGDGDATTSGDGDGDGDATTSGDGDGDGDATTSGDGDGDGDATTAGDGDGDSTTTGDGDGDGDGDLETCRSDDDCVAASHTDGACYSPGCSGPTAATRDEVADDPCLVAWDGVTAPAVPDGCEYDGDRACTAACEQPPACIRPYCSPAGTCELITSQDPKACELIDVDCKKLENVFNSVLDDASACLAGGTVETTECDEALTVKDLCGCDRIINNNEPLKATAVAAAALAYQSQCEAPKICQVLDCGVGTDAGVCELTEHPYGVCRFK